MKCLYRQLEMSLHNTSLQSYRVQTGSEKKINIGQQLFLGTNFDTNNNDSNISIKV